MNRKHKGRSNRIFRHYRLRKKVVGNPERPRLSVAPSLNHIEAQIIDDFDQKTLIGLSTKSKDFKKASGFGKGGNVEAAVAFGSYVAVKAREKGINKVVFDLSGYLYHGRIKAFADAAREKGLSF